MAVQHAKTQDLAPPVDLGVILLRVRIGSLSNLCAISLWF
jgi:hypothetical protein